MHRTPLKDIKELLHTAAYYPEEIARVLDRDNPSFLKFDPELGYTQIDHVFRDGIENTLSAYTYEPRGGHRKMINHADAPCRINTYGDSFTQCAQVSDGETWQEVLAAHFREPIRNFGVGGYGVYHAYRRAMRVETTDLAAENIILNVWDDDHVRSLDPGRWIRVAWTHKELPRGGGEGTYPAHGFPWAHLRYDLERRDFVELPGLCRNEDDLRKLADRDYYYEAFKDDSIVRLFAIEEGAEAPVEELESVAEAFGLRIDLRNPGTRGRDAGKLRLTYGLKATEWILRKLRAWTDSRGGKLMILLSYDTPAVKRFIQKGERFDRELVEYLDRNGFAYIDCLKPAADEYKQFNVSVEAYLERFYVARAGAQVFGHYNPYGNFWFAHTIRKGMVNWLDPKPPAYR